MSENIAISKDLASKKRKFVKLVELVFKVSEFPP